MRYMSGKTTESWFALLLIFYGVPLWIIVLGFKKNEQFWYRQFTYFGRFDIVGTSVKQAHKLPQNIAVDEKFTWLRAKLVYVAMLVGMNCLLGICLSQRSDEVSLEEAYGEFKTEATEINRDYQVISVVTDGWKATSNAIKKLFCESIIILCFLHSVIKIRNVAQKEPCKKELFNKIWEIYRQENPKDFVTKMDELKQCSSVHIQKPSVIEQLDKMQQKTEFFTKAYQQKNALTTSNSIDRPMRMLDRFLFNHRSGEPSILPCSFSIRSIDVKSLCYLL